jgi:hypothetical protein
MAKRSAPDDVIDIKLKFCKHCGSQIDMNTHTCTGCGKKVFGLPKLSKQKVWNVFSIILIVIFAGFSLYNYWVAGSYQDKLDRSLKENASLTEKFESQSLQIKTLQRSLEIKEDTKQQLYAQVGKLQEEANFLENKIAFVTPTGTKYHRYGCQYIKDSRYWAYNIEQMSSRGYTPCEVCFNSNEKSSTTYKPGQYLIDQYGIDPDSETKKSGYTLEDIQAIREGRATFSYEGVDYKD